MKGEEEKDERGGGGGIFWGYLTTIWVKGKRVDWR